jgi:hypothetical protein
MMKIALCLSGLTRLSVSSAASWGRLIGKYNPDIYIHTWDDQNNALELLNVLNLTFNPKQVQIDPLPSIDTSVYPDRHWPYIDVYKSLSMWTSISAAHKMAKDSQYDIIIRGRMDFLVNNFQISLFDGITLPYDIDKIVHQFIYKNILMHGFNDHFAYGPPKWMDVYVNTLEEIPILYSQEGVDYCPENFLAANLTKNKVPLILQKMDHRLVRKY